MSRLWGNVVVTDDALTRCFYELRRHLSQAGGDERLPGPDRNPAQARLSAERDRPAGRALRRRRLRRQIRVRANAGSPVAAAGDGPGLRRHCCPLLLEVPGPDAGPRERRDDPFDRGAPVPGHERGEGPALPVGRRDRGDPEPPDPGEEPARHFAHLDVRAARRVAGRSGDRRAARRGLRARRQRATSRAASFASRRSSSTSRPTRTSGRRPTTGRSTTCLRSQDEIAASVGRALQVELAGDAAPGAAPASVEAYDLYLQGQFHYHRRSEGDIERAIEYYQKAVEISPEFARAWAALAGAYSLAIGELHGNSQRRAARVAGPGRAQGRRARAGSRRGACPAGAVLLPDSSSVTKATSTCASPPRSTRTIRSCSDSRRRMPCGMAISTGPPNCGERPLPRTRCRPRRAVTIAYFLHLDGQLEESLAENRRALELNPDAGPEAGRRDRAHPDPARPLRRGYGGDRANAGRQAARLRARAPAPRARAARRIGRRARAAGGLSRRRSSTGSISRKPMAYRGQERRRRWILLLEFRQRLDREHANSGRATGGNSRKRSAWRRCSGRCTTIRAGPSLTGHAAADR